MNNRVCLKIRKFLFFLLLLSLGAIATVFFLGDKFKIRAIDDTWSPIGNVYISFRFDDEDNGDGIGDGAINVDGQDSIGNLGVAYDFQGIMKKDDTYHIKTTVYNINPSYVSYFVQLFNVSDNVILSTSQLITINGKSTNPAPVTTSLNYTANAADAGDTLQLRYIRGYRDKNGHYINQSGHQGRDFIIDNANFNGKPIPKFSRLFLPKPFIDFPSTTPLKSEVEEMNHILDKVSNWLIGITPPAKLQINNAIKEYGKLKIVVNNNGKSIEGKLPIDGNQTKLTYKSWEKAAFLKIFIQHLKFNPTDTVVYDNGLTIQEMAVRTVWFFSDMFYSGKLPQDYNNYSFRLFVIPAVFLTSYLNENQRDLFFFSFYLHSKKLVGYWSSGTTKVTNLDIIGNISVVPLVFGLLQNTSERKLQWVRGFKRYYERFMSYSVGTFDGIKPDGSSFHHYSALNNYTYNYNTPMKMVSILDGTSFQISSKAYKIFRDAVYAQLFFANDNVEPISMSGRHPHKRSIALNKHHVTMLAIAGKNILGLSEADPVLIKAYVRHWGGHPDFPKVEAENLSGFAQFNHHSAAVFWKNNWLAVARGETNWSFGAEIYNRPNNFQNIYGRYQSYGALEIIYPGGEERGNGFKVDGWDWNFNPGTTSIVLPWNLLKSEYRIQKERQKNSFTGSLAFGIKKNKVLSKTHGKLGVFAMDFVEDPETGSTQLSPITHNPSFEFQKSVFFFDDYIIALGSGINNNDTKHKTITTLYQRFSGVKNDVIVNGHIFSVTGENNFSSNSDNWIIDNFNTGYYIVNGSGTVHIQRSNQKSPIESEPDVNNPKSFGFADYSVGFLNHGYQPMEAGYEFVLKPDTNSTEMTDFAKTMSVNLTKPYAVYQKNKYAHIVVDKNNKVYAHALFTSNTSLPTPYLESNSEPCLIIYQETKGKGNKIKLALSNPNLGFKYKHFSPSTSVHIKITLRGYWNLASFNPDVTLISSKKNKTIFEFNTKDGLPIEIDLIQNK